MTAIQELQAAITSVADKSGASIGGIGSRQRGSGVVIADGKVLTNAHNVRGDEVTVTFADGRSTRGQLSGVDWDGDLAVISVDTGKSKALAWADGGSVDVGAVVFGAAATSGGGTRVTLGTVSRNNSPSSPIQTHSTLSSSTAATLRFLRRICGCRTAPTAACLRRRRIAAQVPGDAMDAGLL